MGKLPLLIASHATIAVAGFAAGIYTLPILTAPSAPTTTEMAAALSQAQYTGEFRRTLAGSDFLHWGEGTVSVGPQFISLHGRVAPGPDYMLYLSPEFVETEAAFNKLKADMVRVGNVKTFENFLVTVPGSINPEKYNTVVIWCESFGEFITAAKYR